MAEPKFTGGLFERRTMDDLARREAAKFARDCHERAFRAFGVGVRHRVVPVEVVRTRPLAAGAVLAEVSGDQPR